MKDAMIKGIKSWAEHGPRAHHVGKKNVDWYNNTAHLQSLQTLGSTRKDHVDLRSGHLITHQRQSPNCLSPAMQTHRAHHASRHHDNRWHKEVEQDSIACIIIPQAIYILKRQEHVPRAPGSHYTACFTHALRSATPTWNKDLHDRRCSRTPYAMPTSWACRFSPKTPQPT